MIDPATAPTVAVVGAGISGLAAARHLAEAGARVVLVEAAERLGGQIHTREIGGLPVDVGAEALHLGVPHVAGLVAELGLAEAVLVARPGGSLLWTPGGARPLPAGVGPAGPTRLLPVLTSRAMTPAGLVRAGLEPLVTAARGGIDLSTGHDVSVGGFVTGRFGAQVTRRLVDPLLGNLHSGDVDTLSLRACVPALVPAATAGRSLLRHRRTREAPRRPGADGRPAGTAAGAPVFASWSGGLATLVGAMLDGLDVQVRLRTAARGVTREAGRLSLRVGPSPARPLEADAGPGADAGLDGVVLAVPAPAAARLIAAAAPEAAAALACTRMARTAVVVLGYDPGDVEDVPALARNGLLVPSNAGSLLKAATHLSTKWPHLAGGDLYLLRASVGRARTGPREAHRAHGLLDELDDAEVVDRVRRDLRRFTGLAAAPRLAHVQRWDRGIPQLEVGHPDRVAAARAVLGHALPGVALAGASYDGIGVAACLASGRRAADDVLAATA